MMDTHPLLFKSTSFSMCLAAATIRDPGVYLGVRQTLRLASYSAKDFAYHALKRDRPS